LGHLRYLVEREGVDAVFVPHLIRVGRKQFICPKFMGLPDMVRTTLPKLFPIFIWQGQKGDDLWKAHAIPTEWQKKFPAKTLQHALRKAEESYKKHWMALSTPPSVNSNSDELGMTIGIIAHPYCLHDNYINLNFVRRLEELGIKILYPEMVPNVWLKTETSVMNKPLFWTLGRRSLGAAQYYIDRGVNGVIHLAAFGCGPESMVGEFIEEQLRTAGVPFLHINLDEHSGEAGLATRLEAFVDMLTRRKKLAGYLSHHGRDADFAQYHLSGDRY
jgi:predicted nucleotide-binding protein (sugar kinase/HSP70/actin superfamily)